MLGCSFKSPGDGPPTEKIDPEQIESITPKYEPLSRQGNPTSYIDPIYGNKVYPLKSSQGFTERGLASWYGSKFHQRLTSNGEFYDMYALSAAHKTLPLPTYLEVTNLHNGKKLIVRVNDRGPFHQQRILDLSYAAAVKLGFSNQGTTQVEIKAIDTSADRPQFAVADINQPIPNNIVNHSIKAKEEKRHLFLQLGAFSQQKNAKILQKRLLNEGLKGIVLSSVQQKKKVIYRLRIGPITRKSEGDTLLKQAKKLGVNSARLLHAPVN